MTTGEKNLERHIFSIDQRPFYIYGLGYQEPKTAMELGIVSLSLTLYLCHLINKQIKLDRVYYKVLLNLACIDTASVLQFMTEFNLLAIWMLKEAVTITVLSPLSNYTWLCWMAPHSSTLAWKTPWMEEPGGLQCMGSLRVGHDWATSLSLFTFMHCRRKWQPTPVFLPGESQGRGSLVGCRLWGHTESDTTEAT